MHEEPIFFASAFEALFARTLRGRLTPELKEKLRAAGVDVDRRLKVAYPFKVWEDVVGVVARELHPELEVREAWFRLGQDFFAGYEATMIGKAAIGLARVIGLDRLLARLTSQMRNTNNGVEGKVELRERGVVRLRLRLIDKFKGRIHPAEPQVPQYLRGVLLGMMHGLGMTDARVEILHSHAQDRDSLYELTWTER